MTPELHAKKPGFTLIELMVTILISTIVIFGIGVVLVDSQRGWNRMYDRVHGEIVTDAYVARKTFDAVVRKCTIKRSLLELDNRSVAVFYYQDLTSTEPDRYAHFRQNEDLLQIDYGEYDWEGHKMIDTSSTVTLARNVTDLQFSVDAFNNVQMVLALEKGQQAMTVTCSSVRHNE